MNREHWHAGCGCGGVPAAFSVPGNERRYEASRPFLIEHLSLDVALDFERRAIAGTATLRFQRAAREATTLELDALAFRIHGLRVDLGDGWEEARFDYDDSKLRVEVPLDAVSGSVEISYEARPQRGLYFLAPDAEVKDRPTQVWTQCQDEDARHWFPCVDRPHVKMTSEIKVRVPRGMTALSNGRLVAQDTPKTGATWSYHFSLERPHPSYLVTLVAGTFTVIKDETPSSRVPLSYYLPPGKEADGKRALANTPRMLELFAELTGVPFPWGQYSQVVVSDFVFGGMENTSATTLYEHVLIDARAALDVETDDLVAHELAHQWFGNYVTCRDWSEAWLNEGFATFFENIEREQRLGRDDYDARISRDLDTYLSEAESRYQRPIVCRDYSEPIELFDRHLYEKGGLVLHMLRRELGDEDFWRGVQLYLGRHAHGVVETRDLQACLEEVSGRSLARFVDEWLYKPGHPSLKVSMSWESGMLSVRLRQTQKAPNVPIYQLTLEVDVCVAGVTQRHKKLVDSADDVLAIPLARKPEWVAFDPELRIVGQIEVTAPREMLRAQLERGATTSVRCRAARTLAKRADLLTLELLGQVLKNEAEPWLLRVEAANALGNARVEESFKELAAALVTTEPHVRRAVARALGGFRTAASAKLLAPLAKKDASYLVEGEALRALGATRQEAALDTFTRALARKSWADVVGIGAIDGLCESRRDDALDWIVQSTRYGTPTRMRRAAVRALPKLSNDARTRGLLEDLLDDRDPHVRADAVGALADLGDARARGALQQRLKAELDGRVARRLREALRSLTRGPQERRSVNEEMQSLHDELNALKLRLTKLEAASGTTDTSAEKAAPAKKARRASQAAAPKRPPTSPAKRAIKKKSNSKRRP